MKALETGATIAAVLTAASILLVLVALAVAGVVGGATGYGCW